MSKPIKARRVQAIRCPEGSAILPSTGISGVFRRSDKYMGGKRSRVAVLDVSDEEALLDQTVALIRDQERRSDDGWEPGTIDLARDFLEHFNFIPRRKS